MIFRPELAMKIVRGEKQATRRRINVLNPKSPWRETPPLRYPEGKEFAIQPDRGADRVANAVVTVRAIRPLGQVTDLDARREGFDSRGAFREAWIAINGSWRNAERVHVIEFKLIGPDCMGCDGCGWCEGSPAWACTDCYGTGIEVSAAARALIAKVEAEREGG